MTAQDIEKLFQDELGIYEIDDTEFKYSENPTYIKIKFSIDFKEEFINNQNKILQNFLINYCRFENNDILEIAQKEYCIYSFIYENGKLYNDFIIETYDDKLIYVFIKVGIESYLNKIYC